MSRDERLAKFYHLGTEADRLDDHAWDPVSRYHEFTEIGRGGMKIVYKAYDSHGERYVAYAKVRDDIDPKYRTAFIQEAKLTASLEHPNIMTIHDIGLERNGMPFFTMELKTGDTLATILEKLNERDAFYLEKYDLDTLLVIFLKICDAIAYAHDKKVVHLDLKPENIQVGHFGEVLVCDWGLSQSTIPDDHGSTVDLQKESVSGLTTLYGEIKGTPGYMSPEQIKTPHQQNHLSDIYALGAILYGVLCYRRPQEGEMDQVLKSTLEGKWVDTMIHNEQSPIGLNAVAKRAMELSPEKRYPNVSELIQEIQQYRLGFATRAEQASTFKIMSLLFQRHKTMTLVLLANLCLFLMGLYIFIAQIQEREHQALVAKLKAEENLLFAKANEQKALAATKDFYRQQIINRQNFFDWTDYSKFRSSLNKSIKGLNSLLEAYPDFVEVNGILGYLSFIKQDFRACEHHLGQYTDIYGYMLPFLKEFEAKKIGSDILPLPDFLDLLHRLEPFKNLHTKMLYYYLWNTKNSETKINAIYGYYQRMNPNWKEQVFDYSSEEKRLKISGPGFESLMLMSLPLTVLNIQELDLSNTDVRHLEGIQDLRLDVLKIYGTKIKDIEELKYADLRNLRRLVIHKNQFSVFELESLPESVVIRYQVPKLRNQ